MTIVIPSWAIVVGYFALLSEDTQTPTPPTPPTPDISIPAEFWFLFWGVLIFAFLLGVLVDYLFKEKNI